MADIDYPTGVDELKIDMIPGDLAEIGVSGGAGNIGNQSLGFFRQTVKQG
jgi:hypothetical protein